MDKSIEKAMRTFIQEELKGFMTEVNGLRRDLAQFKSEVLEKLEVIQNNPTILENQRIELLGKDLFNRMDKVPNTLEGKGAIFHDLNLVDFPLWKEVLNKIQSTISKPSFDTWFNGTFAKQSGSDTLVIFSKNEFTSDWLAERYRLVILSILKDLTNIDFDIQFSIQ
ncbi:MAG TPA: DnaA N-terminal domain-containing protein [Pseudoneobacillus sp.]|nr:DnaA N-terminal domain-containing protein [Pseudoneobacillus sp.]